MYLARRETGKRIWIYPVCLPNRSPVAWTFEPQEECGLRRTGLSGDGWCAIGATPGEARQVLVTAELLQNG